jgi:hypothetical protein
MDALVRFLYRPVHLRPEGANPCARQVLWPLLVGWVVLHVADWTPTAALLVRVRSHEDNLLQAALLARGGLLALAVYKVLVIAGGAALTLLGVRFWPQMLAWLMALCELLDAAAVANNVRWLVPR